MTAVEWLVQELAEHGLDHIYLAQDIIEKAKERERKQIEEAILKNRPHKCLSDEWGNEDWRDRGEMGGY